MVVSFSLQALVDDGGVRTWRRVRSERLSGRITAARYRVRKTIDQGPAPAAASRGAANVVMVMPITRIWVIAFFMIPSQGNQLYCCIMTVLTIQPAASSFMVANLVSVTMQHVNTGCCIACMKRFRFAAVTGRKARLMPMLRCYPIIFLSY